MSYDTRLQQWICNPLMFLWLNNRKGCDIAGGRCGVTCWTRILKHCSENLMQFPSILCMALSNFSV